MKSNDFDLRFVIGLFFIIVSLLLFIASIAIIHGDHINRNVGSSFLIFGVIMVCISWKAKFARRKKSNVIFNFFGFDWLGIYTEIPLLILCFGVDSSLPL